MRIIKGFYTNSFKDADKRQQYFFRFSNSNLYKQGLSRDSFLHEKIRSYRSQTGPQLALRYKIQYIHSALIYQVDILLNESERFKVVIHKQVFELGLLFKSMSL